MGFLIRKKLSDRLSAARDAREMLKRCLDGLILCHPAKLHKRFGIFDQSIGSQARAFQHVFAGACLWVTMNQREAFPEIVDLVQRHVDILSIFSIPAKGLLGRGEDEAAKQRDYPIPEKAKNLETQMSSSYRVPTDGPENLNKNEQIAVVLNRG